MVQGVNGVVEMVEFKLIMDKSAGVESNSEAAWVTTADTTGVFIVDVTAVVEGVAGWDTKPAEDVTGGAELVEEDERYFVESTDIIADDLGVELAAALLPAWYKAAR